LNPPTPLGTPLLPTIKFPCFALVSEEIPSSSCNDTQLHRIPLHKVLEQRGSVGKGGGWWASKVSYIWYQIFAPEAFISPPVRLYFASRVNNSVRFFTKSTVSLKHELCGSTHCEDSKGNKTNEIFVHFRRN